jgi:hypothetical protein
MPSALFAEWIIARLSDRSRAASMVGDLVETTAQKGPFWFWFSVARIVFSLTWRRAVAYGAAAFVGATMVKEFRTVAYVSVVVHTIPGPGNVIGEVHTAPGPWQLSFTLITFGTLLWIACSYAAIRYGLRDKFSQVAFGFSCLYTVRFFYWRVPIVTVVCVSLALCIVIVSIRSVQRGRAFVALVVALVLGFGGSWLSMYLERIVLGQYFYYPTTFYLSVFFTLLAIWTTTAACALMHRLMLQRDQQFKELSEN